MDLMFINKFKLKMVENLILYDNNVISIALTKNAKSQHCTKYINAQYYYI